MVDVYDNPPLEGMLQLTDTASIILASPTARSSLLSFRPGSTCLQGSFGMGGRLAEAAPPPVSTRALISWECSRALSG